MGYTTEFQGQIKVVPPLSADEIAYLTKFNKTRRMHCTQGPYYVERGGFAGQADGPDVIEYNQAAEGQPGLWCQWTPTEDGTAIEWDGGEKFYDSETWMKYLIDHFIGSAPIARKELPFLQPHTLNGTIDAQGEDSDDRWRLIVENNVVKVAQAETRTFGVARGIAAALFVLALGFAPAQAQITQCTTIGDDFMYCMGGQQGGLSKVCTRIGDTVFCY